MRGSVCCHMFIYHCMHQHFTTIHRCLPTLVRKQPVSEYTAIRDSLCAADGVSDFNKKVQPEEVRGLGRDLNPFHQTQGQPDEVFSHRVNKG